MPWCDAVWRSQPIETRSVLGSPCSQWNNSRTCSPPQMTGNGRSASSSAAAHASRSGRARRQRVANAGHIAPSSSGRARNEYELAPTGWSGAEFTLRARSVPLAMPGASLTARGCRLPRSARRSRAAIPLRLTPAPGGRRTTGRTTSRPPGASATGVRTPGNGVQSSRSAPSRRRGDGYSLLCWRSRCAPRSTSPHARWIVRRQRLYGRPPNTAVTPLCRRYACCISLARLLDTERRNMDMQVRLSDPARKSPSPPVIETE